MPVLKRLRPLSQIAAPRKGMLLMPVALLLAACATTTSAPPDLPTRPAEPSVRTAPPAPPTQEDLALQSLAAMQDRLYRVAAPLIVNNAQLCKTQARNLLGFTAKNRYSYSNEYAASAQKMLRLGDKLQVMGVLAGSGAANAGVRVGDVLLSVEDRILPEGDNAERQAASILAPLVTGRSTVKIAVLRDGGNLTLNVPLTHACAYGFELGNTDNVTAYADGYRVLVSRGMMNFVRSDDELAYVLAKEMAHNTLGHPARQRMSATVGGIIDNLTRIRPDMSTMSGLAGVKPMPQELDAIADRLSLYMLVRAGYKIDDTIPFWRRIAAQYPPSVPNAYTAMHPGTNFRVAAMDRTLKDIKAKQAANKPLMP